MAEEISFGDKNTTDEFGTNISRYKAVKGAKDIIRIISQPVKFYQHALDFFPKIANCGKTAGKCIFCEKNYDRNIRVACIIVHLAEKKDSPDSKYREVGELKVWIFGGDKWKTLNGILDDYPEIKKNGFNKHDLIISCIDADFQKLEIRPTMKEGMLKKEMLVKYKEAKKQLDWYVAPCSIERQNEILREAGMIKDDDDSGIGSHDEDASEVIEEEINKKKSSELVDKHSEEPKKEDDIDSILGGLDDSRVPF